MTRHPVAGLLPGSRRRSRSQLAASQEVDVTGRADTATGATRALQPRELFASQAYATAIYRAELAKRLRALGYGLVRGKSGQPEIEGFPDAYLEASSPRRQQIKTQLAAAQRSGAEAAEIAAHQTRTAKRALAREAMQARDRGLAEEHGHPAAHAIQAAEAHTQRGEQVAASITAQAAVTFAKDRSFEREAVHDERALRRDALDRGRGVLGLAEIKAEFETRVGHGEFTSVATRPGAASRAVTTRDMIALERETIAMMRRGQRRSQPLIQETTRRQLEAELAHLNDAQRAAVQQVFGSRSQVTAFNGAAGVGKTTVLGLVRAAAEREAYAVAGFAPTSRAAQNLADAGVPTSTLQAYLARGPQPSDGPRPKRLLMVDEASLTGTVQAHALFRSLGPEDRVLLIGDVRQHQAVEAGRPFQQLQEAGVETVRLDTIVRQTDPALKAVVAELAGGHVAAAVQPLRDQGRVHEFRNRRDRFAAIAQAYVEQPDGTLVVSPDNLSRQDLNTMIHCARQDAGQVARDEHRVTVLVPRQDLTGADRQWAAQYVPGDVVRYTKGSRAYGLKAGDYARIDQVDTQRNLLVMTQEGGGQVTYDPRRLQGVTVYRDAERAFAVGDRVQLTAPDRGRKLANRELGTIATIDPRGTLTIRFDSGRTVEFVRNRDRHLDYGYAITSHSSQGLTADRVLVHVDTAHRGAALLNRRFAYVALSRGRTDARIYTNDTAKLADALGRETSRRSALGVSSVRDGLAGAIRSLSAHVARRNAKRQHELAR